MNFEVWDLPGQLDFRDPSFDMFHTLGTLIWVIDAQADYHNSLHLLHDIILYARDQNPTINVEVFIHKADGLSEDYQYEIKEDIAQRIVDELQDNGMDDVRISFHLTSIYDHSIREALSKVIQKVIPYVETIENLIDVLSLNSGIHKAFIFSTSSKIFIATDSSPVDLEAFGICSDFIDLIRDIHGIYGYNSPPPPPPQSTI